MENKNDSRRGKTVREAFKKRLTKKERSINKNIPANYTNREITHHHATCL